MRFFTRWFSKKEDVSFDLDLPFEFEVVPGEMVLKRLAELAGNGSDWPLILSEPDKIEILLENMEETEETFEEILESANEMSLEDWFENQKKEYEELPRGQWPKNPWPEGGITAHIGVSTQKPLKNVVIGKIPVKQSWEVAAFLKIGGWNECPIASEHVAFFRKWGEEYGARVASYTGSVVEFFVDNPPKTKEEALKLAEEQFLYCPDIVYQGVGTIENLAASLLDADTWHFWWD